MDVVAMTMEIPSYNFITDRLAVGDVNARAVPGWHAIVSILATTPWDEQSGAPKIAADIPVYLVDVMDGHHGLDIHLGPACAFIMQHIKHGCVLVHCGVGRSRSVSLVAAYLCRRYAGMSLDQALGLIAQRRPNICPWDGFKREITAWLKLDELAQRGPRL